MPQSEGETSPVGNPNTFRHKKKAWIAVCDGSGGAPQKKARTPGSAGYQIRESDRLLLHTI
ncbi:hypothetical protein OAE72_01455 [Akkermansiaceae bacterium]|nr:hypothetical protein [bacterium]MDB4680601.1 hypothetical protein [Akkermansiaceae bacterium]